MDAGSPTALERDRREREWLEREVALAAALTDADRVRILKDLLRTAAAIRRAKTAEELERDEAVRRILDEAPGRSNWLATIERLSR